MVSPFYQVVKISVFVIDRSLRHGRGQWVSMVFTISIELISFYPKQYTVNSDTPQACLQVGSIGDRTQYLQARSPTTLATKPVAGIVDIPGLSTFFYHQV